MTVKFSNKRLKNWPELKLLILWKINTSCKSDTTRLQEQFANQSLVIIFNIESWFHSNIFRQFWKSYILHIVIFRLEFRAFCCFRGTKDTNTKSLSPKGLKIFCFWNAFVMMRSQLQLLLHSIKTYRKTKYKILELLSWVLCPNHVFIFC